MPRERKFSDDTLISAISAATDEAGRPATVQEIAEELDCHPLTARRYLKQALADGSVCCTSLGGKGGQQGWFLPDDDAMASYRERVDCVAEVSAVLGDVPFRVSHADGTVTISISDLLQMFADDGQAAEMEDVADGPSFDDPQDLASYFPTFA